MALTPDLIKRMRKLVCKYHGDLRLVQRDLDMEGNPVGESSLYAHCRKEIDRCRILYRRDYEERRFVNRGSGISSAAKALALEKREKRKKTRELYRFCGATETIRTLPYETPQRLSE